MITPELVLILRENHDEVVSRWLDNCRGHIADEFEQMLETPMGQSVAASMFAQALECLEAEDYETAAILRRARETASNSSFRRAAVGFSLPDIITTAVTFRNALVETLLNHFNMSTTEDAEALLDCLLRLTRLGDALVSGELAGFFSFNKFGDREGGIAEAM